MNVALVCALLIAPQAAPAPPPATVDVPPAVATAQDYRIGPGDILRVNVFGQADLSQTVVVEPNGTFAFPFIGAVNAKDATTAEVETQIRTRLSKGYIRDSQVSVAVQEVRSKVVFVVGEVARPGTYPLPRETRLVEILSKAGPLSANAGSEVLVVRPSRPVDRPVLPQEVAASTKGNPKADSKGSKDAPKGASKGAAPKADPALPSGDVQKIDMREIQSGHLDRNIVLQPNDTVFVPQAARIFVSGEVRNPGAFAYTSGITARQAVSLAGGYTEDASKGSVRVVRNIDGKTKTVKLRLDDPLQPGDTVVVKAKWF